MDFFLDWQHLCSILFEKVNKTKQEPTSFYLNIFEKQVGQNIKYTRVCQMPPPTANKECPDLHKANKPSGFAIWDKWLRSYILPFGDSDTSPLPWLFICNRLSKCLLIFEGWPWSPDETRFSTATLKVFGARCWKELNLRNPLNKQTSKHIPPSRFQSDWKCLASSLSPNLSLPAHSHT